jgi:acetolactate synthase-1/2/3 large subunit
VAFRLHPGVQMAIDALVINVAGGAYGVNMQELGTAMRLQAASHSSSSTTSVWAWSVSGRNCCTSGIRRTGQRACRFRETAEAFGAKGILCSDPDTLDDAIMEMLT